MAPQRVSKRKQPTQSFASSYFDRVISKQSPPTPRVSESGMIDVLEKIFTESLAAIMPDLVEKVGESILQSIRGSAPDGAGSSGLGDKRRQNSRIRNAKRKERRRAAVSSGGQGKRPKCDKCGGTHARDAACWFCARCKKEGHTVRFCRVPLGSCYECGAVGHRRNRCPKLLSSSSGLSSGFGAVSGKELVLGVQEVQQDPDAVIGTFLFFYFLVFTSFRCSFAPYDFEPYRLNDMNQAPVVANDRLFRACKVIRVVLFA